MARNLHGGVDISAKWIRLENFRCFELSCERRQSLTFGILDQKALTERKVPFRDLSAWDVKAKMYA